VSAERKMTTKALDFSPGKPAVTLLEIETTAGLITEKQEAAPPQTGIMMGQEPRLNSLKGVVIYLAPAEAIALKVYAAQHSTSIQQLGTEAFAELFRQHGINGGVLTRVRANRKHGGNR